MFPEVITLIPAAGLGQRLGRPEPKALAPICAHSILAETVRRLRLCPSVNEILVAYTPGYEEQFKMAVPGVHLVLGGGTRQESVQLMLNAAAEMHLAKQGDLVLVHDAARCLIEPENVEAVICCARKTGAATLAVPVVDTLVRVKVEAETLWDVAVPRNDLWQIQTPQVFEFGVLKQAHTAADKTVVATDDAGLVARLRKVSLVPGNRSNIKITTPDDLVIAKRLVRREQADQNS
jgi:2-C-methyl-D-erythritol 4-phosphate cytidylyltransferase